MEAIIAAAITAIASIIVALIQAKSAQKQAKLLRESSTREITKTPSHVTDKEMPVMSRAFCPHWLLFLVRSRLWWWVSAVIIVIIGNYFIREFVPWEKSDYLIYLGVIPLYTFLLAYLRPIRWGYVAAFVTLLVAITIIGEYISGGWYDESDMPIFALIFIGNSFIAAGIAYWRQHKHKHQ